MMVLPLASALAKINREVEDAARTLGAPSWRVFWRISLPLSLPGLAVGFTLVFSLTASSYVTPAILGGTAAQMLGNLIEQQIAAVYDWPFGATVALVLVATVLGDQRGLKLVPRAPVPHMSGRPSAASALLYTLTAVTLLFIAAPLLVTMSLSVSDTQFVTFPPRGFTLVWYGKVLRDPDFQSALSFSLWLAGSATAGALLLGVPAAFALVRFPVPGAHGDAVTAAVAADLPSAGHRLGAAATVLDPRLDFGAGQPADRPYPGDLALCRAHRRRPA